MADETKPDDTGSTAGAPSSRRLLRTPPARRRAAAAAPPRTRRRPAPRQAARGAAARSRRQDDVGRVGGRRGGKGRGRAGRRRPRPRRDPDDTSPLLTRRAWMGLAWGAFSAASAAALAATGRFMFPNVLNEPPQQFKAGFPNEYGMGVDERWKEKFGVWIVRTPDDIVARAQRLLRAAASRARTWAARRTTCRPKPSSSARATAAGSARPASTSRARRRGRSSARASCSPTTARSWSTRRASSSTSWGSGPTRRRFSEGRETRDLNLKSEIYG